MWGFILATVMFLILLVLLLWYFSRGKKRYENRQDRERLQGVLDYLHSIGIKGEVVDNPVRIKLNGQNIDEMKMSIRPKKSGTESREYLRADYIVRGDVRGLSDILNAKKQEPWWCSIPLLPLLSLCLEILDRLQGQTLNREWTGGQLAQLLNSDTLLNVLLSQEGQMEIRIEPNQEMECVEIITEGEHHKSTFSKESFEAYNQIAGHIRSFLPLPTS